MALDTSNLTVRERIVLGGAGALTPILLNLLVVDASTVFQSVTLLALTGYTAKVAILFYLGAITAVLHKKERDSLRLFELGIVAPALLTAVLNGANSGKRVDPPEKIAPLTIGLDVLLPATLHAQAPAEEHIFSFRRPPPETMFEQFMRGFTGGTRRGLWFVCIRRRFATLQEAVAAADRLEAAGVRARVYTDGGPRTPDLGAGDYMIALVDWITEDVAQQWVVQARNRGLDAFAWTTPRT